MSAAAWVLLCVQAALRLAHLAYWRAFVLAAWVSSWLGGRAHGQARLNKVPNALALAVRLDTSAGAKGPSALAALVASVAQAVVWSLDAGVDEVVVFEESGTMARRDTQAQVAQELERLLQPRRRPWLLFGNLRRVQAVNLFLHGDSEPSCRVQCAKAEEAAEEVAVRFLCAEDAGRDVARVAQALVTDADLNLDVDNPDDDDAGSCGITEALLTQRFRASRASRRRLDLVLSYARGPTLQGFPPWMLRTPEIMYVSVLWPIWAGEFDEDRCASFG